MSAAVNNHVENAPMDGIDASIETLVVSKLVQVANTEMGTNHVYYRNIIHFYLKYLRDELNMGSLPELDMVACKIFFISRAIKIFKPHESQLNYYSVDNEYVLRQGVIIDPVIPPINAQEFSSRIDTLYVDAMRNRADQLQVPIEDVLLSVLGEVAKDALPGARHFELPYQMEKLLEDNRLQFVANKPRSVQKTLLVKLTVILKDLKILRKPRSSTAYSFDACIVLGLNLLNQPPVAVSQFERAAEQIMGYVVKDQEEYNYLHFDENDASISSHVRQVRSDLNIQRIRKMVHHNIKNGFCTIPNEGAFQANMYHPLLPSLVSAVASCIYISATPDGFFAYDKELKNELISDVRGLNGLESNKAMQLLEKIFTTMRRFGVIVHHIGNPVDKRYSLNYKRLLLFPIETQWTWPGTIDIEHVVDDTMYEFRSGTAIPLMDIGNTGHFYPYVPKTWDTSTTSAPHHPMLRFVFIKTLLFITKMQEALHSYRRDKLIYHMQNNFDLVLSQPPLTRAKISAMLVNKLEELGFLVKEGKDGFLFMDDALFINLNVTLAPSRELIERFGNEPLEVVLAPMLKSDGASSSSSSSTDDNAHKQIEKLETTVKTLVDQVKDLKNELDMLRTVYIRNGRN